MQPYLFPYIGYFQLINAVDRFVFYDDVNFIKNGWINRNRVLVNGKAVYITVPLNNISSFTQINQTEIKGTHKKVLKTIELSYKKAPYFKDVWPIVDYCFSFDEKYISNLAIKSVKSVCDYLNIKVLFEISSNQYSSSQGLQRTERLIKISEIAGASTYINMEGGSALYKKEDFMLNNIQLMFLTPEKVKYQQFSNEFIPNLSILDVLMFNSIDDVNLMLNKISLW